MERLFRLLRADEIDCRIGTIKENGLTLLLYKDARCDMNILDERFGAFGWQRHHNRDNANCIVSIYDEQKGEWIEKEDTGTESNTEAEKGLASDSFKRACFNWGIGRELYTAPLIWISSSNCRIKDRRCYDKFSVKEIGYDDLGVINHLIIANDSIGVDVYDMKSRTPQIAKPVEQKEATQEETKEYICAVCNKKIENPKTKDGKPMSVEDYVAMCMKVYEKPICDTCRRKNVKAS